MKSDMFFKTFIISSLLFLLSGVLFAQEDSVKNNSSYFLNEDNELVQKFTWKGNKNVYRYEFVLEELNEDGEYVPNTTIDTKETELLLPLTAGKYRYCLNIYNFLNYLDYTTDWITFEIIKTYHPVITSVSPTIIYLEEAQTGIFTVEGIDLRKDTVFTFENNIYEIPAEIVSTDGEYTKSRIKVDPELLDTGTYYIRAVNPGGLFDTSGTIKITFKKPMDLDVSVGYSPILLLDIDKTSSDNNMGKDTLFEFFSDNGSKNLFFPLGFDARVSFIPYKTYNFYLGAGLGLNYFMMKYTKEDNSGNEMYSIKAPAYCSHLDVVAQLALRKQVPWKLVLEAHAGVGLFGFAGLTFDFPNFTSEPLWSSDFSLVGGLALQIYRTNRLYFEAGCDFMWSIQYSVDKETNKQSPMMSYYIQPRITVGWQF